MSDRSIDLGDIRFEDDVGPATGAIRTNHAIKIRCHLVGRDSANPISGHLLVGLYLATAHFVSDTKGKRIQRYGAVALIPVILAPILFTILPVAMLVFSDQCGDMFVADPLKMCGYDTILDYPWFAYPAVALVACLAWIALTTLVWFVDRTSHADAKVVLPAALSATLHSIGLEIGRICDERLLLKAPSSHGQAGAVSGKVAEQVGKLVSGPAIGTLLGGLAEASYGIGGEVRAEEQREARIDALQRKAVAALLKHQRYIEVALAIRPAAPSSPASQARPHSPRACPSPPPG